jgi:hypothetical protein
LDEEYVFSQIGIESYTYGLFVITLQEIFTCGWTIFFLPHMHIEGVRFMEVLAKTIERERVSESEKLREPKLALCVSTLIQLKETIK